MEQQDFHECLSNSKSIGLNPCKYSYFVLNIYKETINSFLVALQCLVTDHINYDIIKHQII